MRSPLLTVLFCASAAGLILSGVVHAAAFNGRVFDHTWFLVGGVFATHILGILAVRPAGSGLVLQVKFSEAFRGAPGWVRPAVTLLTVYAGAQMVLAWFASPGGHLGDSSPLALRTFSAIWMLFYAASAGMFLAALNRDEESASERP